MAQWSPEDIPWDRFDPARVDADILKLIKAAAMVEKNSADYAAYLRNVFADDHVITASAGRWADEEEQHGDVLGRWAEMADPEFDFAARFKTFRQGFQVPIDCQSSIRGSRSGELVARCVVEVGTSSYYTALAERADEPVLKTICTLIAEDELRHYKLFYSYLQRYQKAERPKRWSKIKVALGRIVESEDDELAYAYYAANNCGEPYDRRANADAYSARAFSIYRPDIVKRGVSMTLEAVGLKPDGWLLAVLSRVAWRAMAWRGRRQGRSAA